MFMLKEIGFLIEVRYLDANLNMQLHIMMLFVYIFIFISFS